MTVHHTQLDRLLGIFNSFYPRIQFTMKIEGERLNFLDVTIINNNNIIEFDWYQKPTFFGRYLNFLHSPIQKRRFLMIDRAFLLSHPREESRFYYQHIFTK